MGASLLGSNGATGINSGLTRQQVFCGGDSWSGSEANNRNKFGQAGTLTKLWAYISANSLDSGTTTIKIRITGSDGSNSLSIASGATGEFEDASNSDAIAAGDLVNVQIITSGTSGSISPRTIAVIYTPSGTHNFKLLSESIASGIAQGASTTNYLGAFGVNLANTTEANAQFKIRSSGTLRNGWCRVSANTRSDSTTLISRINGANGNILISIPSSATGSFDDASNTDTISDGDLICWAATTGAGTGTITFRAYTLELDAANSAFEMGNSRNATGTAFATATTRFLSVQGGIVSDTTESQQHQNSAIAFTASKLRCYISANTWTLAATLRTRINGGNGAQSVSITAATTGWFEDASNTDSIVAGDLINTSLLTAGSGSMTVHTVALTGATSSEQILSPDPADYDWTALDPTLTPGAVTLSPTTAEYDWVALDATIAAGPVTLSPATADYDWTVNDPVISAGAVTLSPDPAVFTWTANNPTITAGGVAISPDAAEFEWIANDAGISVEGDTTLFPEPAVWNWYAQSPSIEAIECEPLLGCRDNYFTYSIAAGIQPPPGDDCEVLGGCKLSMFTYEIES